MGVGSTVSEPVRTQEVALKNYPRTVFEAAAVD